MFILKYSLKAFVSDSFYFFSVRIIWVIIYTVSYSFLHVNKKNATMKCVATHHKNPIVSAKPWTLDQNQHNILYQV